MTYQQISVFLGVFSMLLFQVEQALRTWIDNHDKAKPYYDGMWLEVLARVERQREAWAKTRKGVVFYIPWARWTAVILGVVSAVLSIIKD
ncbi:hypothetical protein [Bdellovibrio sp. HCB209]|uniref:hypothetical protein n=1 Tax=Bdellovibrio sp. HCB209 TaxID=3394354 RepID=UPI0039B66A96